MSIYCRRQFLKAIACTTCGWSTIAATKSVQSNPSHTMTLHDGRRLGYAEYGDPHGFPVLYFHGLPSCRMEPAVLHAEASHVGCRLVAIDRPGIGLSSCQPGRTIMDWTDDVNEFVSVLLGDASPVAPFAILGFSSGAPYAAACALRLQDMGLSKVAIVSGVKPPEFTHIGGGEGGRLLAFARRHPKLARSLLNVSSRRVRRRPEKIVRKRTKDMACADKSLLQDAYYRNAFIRAYLESMRQGPYGNVNDALLLTSCWNIPFNEITLPVSIWHGACDTTIPAAVAHQLALHIPNSELNIIAGEGHLALFRTCGHDVLNWLSTGDPEPSLQ